MVLRIRLVELGTEHRVILTSLSGAPADGAAAEQAALDPLVSHSSRREHELFPACPVALSEAPAEPSGSTGHLVPLESARRMRHQVSLRPRGRVGGEAVGSVRGGTR
ncbi:MAG: hypothetical protein ACYCZM_04885 [Acidimicrobiales bacterium]